MKTTKTLYLLTILGALLLASIPALAGDEGELTGKVGIGLIAADGNEDSAKSNEYRDITDGATGALWVEYLKGNHFLNLTASNLGMDDQRFAMETGVYGLYRFDVMYDQIPHRYSYTGQTPFAGVGTNNLPSPTPCRPTCRTASPPPTSTGTARWTPQTTTSSSPNRC